MRGEDYENYPDDYFERSGKWRRNMSFVNGMVNRDTFFEIHQWETRFCWEPPFRLKQTQKRELNDTTVIGRLNYMKKLTYFKWCLVGYSMIIHHFTFSGKLKHALAWHHHMSHFFFKHMTRSFNKCDMAVLGKIWHHDNDNNISIMAVIPREDCDADCEE